MRSWSGTLVTSNVKTLGYSSATLISVDRWVSYMSLGLIASRRVVVLSFHISVKVVELLLVRPQVNSDADKSSFLPPKKWRDHLRKWLVSVRRLCIMFLNNRQVCFLLKVCAYPYRSGLVSSLQRSLFVLCKVKLVTHVAHAFQGKTSYACGTCLRRSRNLKQKRGCLVAGGDSSGADGLTDRWRWDLCLVL